MVRAEQYISAAAIKEAIDAASKTRDFSHIKFKNYEFKTRLLGALKKNGLETVQDVLNLSSEHGTWDIVLARRGDIGAASVAAIRDFMEAMGAIPPKEYRAPVPSVNQPKFGPITALVKIAGVMDVLSEADQRCVMGYLMQKYPLPSKSTQADGSLIPDSPLAFRHGEND